MMMTMMMTIIMMMMMIHNAAIEMRRQKSVQLGREDNWWKAQTGQNILLISKIRNRMQTAKINLISYCFKLKFKIFRIHICPNFSYFYSTVSSNFEFLNKGSKLFAPDPRNSQRPSVAHFSGRVVPPFLTTSVPHHFFFYTSSLSSSSS